MEVVVITASFREVSVFGKARLLDFKDLVLEGTVEGEVGSLVDVSLSLLGVLPASIGCLSSVGAD